MSEVDKGNVKPAAPAARPFISGSSSPSSPSSPSPNSSPSSSPSSPNPGRELWAGRLWVAVLVLVVVIALQLVDHRFSFVRGGDNASYVLLARSIAEGLGYSDINVPGSPPHIQYPPLFPIVLSPVYFLFGYNFLLMRMVIIFAFLGSVLMVKRVFSHESGVVLGVLLALATATNFYVLFYAKEIATELPYLFVSLATIGAASRYAQAGDDVPMRTYALVLPILVTAAFMTRLVGVVLYAAVATVLALRLFESSGRALKGLHLKRFLFFAVIGALPLLAWLARAAMVPEGSLTYGELFLNVDYYDPDAGGSILERVRANVALYASILPRTAVGFLDLRKIVPSYVFGGLNVTILALILTGLAYRLYCRRGVMEFYFLYYLLLLIIWPVYGTGDALRYMVPLVPFVYFYLLAGAWVLAGVRGAFARRRVFGFEWFLLAPYLVLLVMNMAEIRAMVWPPSAYSNLRAVSANAGARVFESVGQVDMDVMTNSYFKAELPCYDRYLRDGFILRDISIEGEIASARRPEVIALVSGRHTLKYPYTADTKAMLEFVEDAGVDYLIVDDCYDETADFIKPFIRRYGDLFEVWNEGDYESGIFRFKGR